jgi:hypothetical protein
MKWSNIKNIMVGFLILMNLFMLVIIAVTTMQQSYIPERVINAAIKVIRQSGFEISDDIFPKTYYTLPSYRAQFYSASDLSDLFFGKQVAFRTEEKSLVAVEGNAVLTVNDNYFSYDSGYAAAENLSPKKLKRALEKLGIDMKGSVYDNKAGYFYRMYNGTNLFNMSLEAKTDSDGEICYVKAHWPKELEAGERKKISFIESAAKLKDTFPDGGKIQSIELGYSLNSLGGEKYIFTPAWRVKAGSDLKIID